MTSRTSGTENASGIQLVNDVELAVNRLLISALAVPTFSLLPSHLALLSLLFRHRPIGLHDRRLRVPTRASVRAPLGRLGRVKRARALTVALHSAGAQCLFLRTGRAMVRWRTSAARGAVLAPRRGRAAPTRRRSAIGFRYRYERRRLLVVERQRTLQTMQVSLDIEDTSGGRARTKRSSAVGDVRLSIDMASDRIFCRLAWAVSAGSRNGFRDTGRGGGSSNGDGRVGDALLLRKGLFEERLRVNPADR